MLEWVHRTGVDDHDGRIHGCREFGAADLSSVR